MSGNRTLHADEFELFLVDQFELDSRPQYNLVTLQVILPDEEEHLLLDDRYGNDVLVNSSRGEDFEGIEINAAGVSARTETGNASVSLHVPVSFDVPESLETRFVMDEQSTGDNPWNPRTLGAML